MQKIDPSLIHQVKTSDVLVSDKRVRKLFPKEEIDKLATSISEVGQLQPAVCSRGPNGEIILVAGERRLRACAQLERPLDVIFKEELLDPYLAARAELEENLCRSNLDWKEEVRAKAQLHRLFVEQFGEARSGPGAKKGHGLKDTAEFLGERKTIVYEDVNLAQWLDEIPEVAAAPNKTTAKKIVMTMVDMVKRKKALDDARAAAVAAPEIIFEERKASPISAERNLDEERAKAIAAQEAQRTQQESRILDFDRRCLLGKFEELAPDLQDESFHVVLFDPPWGVDLDTVSRGGGGTTISYEDSYAVYVEMLPQWLRLVYQKMAPNSHLYMFFGIVHHQFVYQTLEDVGFRVNRMPIIWHKKGAHVTRQPDMWPGRAYEPIAFARKGDKPLVTRGAPDVITTPAPPPSIKKIHPSAKHPDIYRELLARSAFPGNLVFDPMFGSGMSLVAAEDLRATHQLSWFGCEMAPHFRNLALENLIAGYHVIAKSDLLGTGGDEPPKVEVETANTLDFRQLSPGGDEWRQYWRDHPEQQEAMLAWKSELSKGGKP